MGIFAGPIYAIRALAVIAKNMNLMKWALLPGMITMAISIAGLWGCVTYGDAIFAVVWPEPEPGWVHGVWSFVSGLLTMISAMMVLVITPWLVMLFGVPLCEPLSARIDQILGGLEVESTVMASVVDALKTTIVLSILGIGGGITLFMLSFIPLIGVFIAPFITFVWTPLFMAFNFYDSPMCRRQLGLRSKFKVVLSHPFQAVSIGLTSAALVSIPVINLVGLPIAVCTAVMAVRDMENKGKLPTAC